MSLSRLPRVEAIHLLRQVDAELIPLLRSLESEEWQKPAVGHWVVRDVAAHLLDGALRRLSLDRDGHRPPATSHDLGQYSELVDFLNGLNATWVEATQRLSPQVITDLLEIVNPEVADYLESLDPEGEAAFLVSWAGESATRVWMDIAREFTERWHHQQQIREAVGAPWLADRHYVEALLATFVRALPRSYGEVDAREGATLLIEITDFDGLSWVLERRANEWQLGPQTADAEPDASIRLFSETAWRLFIKGIGPEAARKAATISGDERLTRPFFDTLAVMA